MEYTDIRYSGYYTCIDSVSAEEHNRRRMVLQNELCEGEQAHAYIIKSNQLNTNWLLVNGDYTLTSVQWHSYVYWFCECQSATTGGRMVSNELCGGEQSHALHNQAPNWNTLELLVMEYTDIQVQWHYITVYWFCECQSWRTGADVSKWIVWGRAVSCLHNQHQLRTTIDSLRWNTLISGTVTLLRVWFCECQRSTTGDGDGLQMNWWGESSLMAYIIKHPIEHKLAPLVMEYTDIGSGHTRVWNSVSARAAQQGDGWSPNELCEEKHLILHNQAHQLEHNYSCDGYTPDSQGTVTLLRVLFCECQSTELRTDGLQMNWWGRAVSWLTYPSTHWTQSDSLWWN